MRYLVDLSAWARSSHPTASSTWRELIEENALLASPIFAVELLHNAINATSYFEMRKDIEDGFDWLRPDGATADLALDMQKRMASADACGQRVKTGDLLIAALAVQHDVGVLHYDRDYDLIAQHGGAGFESRWMATRGSLETGAALNDGRRRAYRKAFSERMIQLQQGADLEVWPKLVSLLEEELRERDLPVPAPADLP